MPRFILTILSCAAACLPIGAVADRPNILWITSEDNGPHLGAYGDAFADTPNLDALAEGGVRYLNCWSNAPVCAPARTTIISGIYPPAAGAQHMRSEVPLPEGIKLYPQLLREAGYYVTNNSKTDYNVDAPGNLWNESSGKAHYRNRPEGAPFMAVFNFTTTHESQIRKGGHELVHNPAEVPIPDYHPDTPEVRRNWAQYYDKITEMDGQVGKVLADLEADGLADDTIVFYYGDHGSGMPRSKRWPFNSGLHVPLIVFVPEKFRDLAPDGYTPGAALDRLVSFVDFAPTLMSIIGQEPPAYHDGHAFMGAHAAPEPDVMFGFRDRMDERYDLVRSARDKQFVYIRNYMPHRIYGQHVSYMFETPATEAWEKLYKEGSLNAAQRKFWEPKPAEELYDLAADPHEVVNLAADLNHRATLERLREAQRAWVSEMHDLGFLPEGEIHERSREAGITPYELARRGDLYPFAKVFSAAEIASTLDPDMLPRLHEAARDTDSAVRFWGVLGILMRGEAAAKASADVLTDALKDPSPYVRIAAAETAGLFGPPALVEAAVDVLVEAADGEKTGTLAAVYALNSLDYLAAPGTPAAAAIAARAARIRALPDDPKPPAPRLGGYVSRLLGKLRNDLKQLRRGAP